LASGAPLHRKLKPIGTGRVRPKPPRCAALIPHAAYLKLLLEVKAPDRPDREIGNPGLFSVFKPVRVPSRANREGNPRCMPPLIQIRSTLKAPTAAARSVGPRSTSNPLVGDGSSAPTVAATRPAGLPIFEFRGQPGPPGRRCHETPKKHQRNQTAAKPILLIKGRRSSPSGLAAAPGRNPPSNRPNVRG
jgi:hypothetical protein